MAGTGPTAAGLSRRGPQASSGWSSAPPTPRRCPLCQAWAGSSPSLAHSEFLCVGGRRGRWEGAGQMVCARPYLLGAGRRGGAQGASLTKPALSAGSWASGTHVVAFLPHPEPPIHTPGAPHGDSPLPLQLRASSGQGAGRGPAGVTRPAVPEVGPGGEQQAHGIRAAAEGPEPAGGGVSRMDSGHTRGGSHRGAPSRPAWRSPVLARPPWGLALCSGLLGCEASAPAARQLHPGLGRFWGSDPQRHQCP